MDPWIAVLGFHSERSLRSGYSNAEVDALIPQGSSTMSRFQREAIYLRIQEILAEERPAIFLYHMKNTYGVSRRVEYTPSQDGFLWMGKARVQD
jgi:peptide/nickel transport system substrate-binding protein